MFLKFSERHIMNKETLDQFIDLYQKGKVTHECFVSLIIEKQKDIFVQQLYEDIDVDINKVPKEVFLQKLRKLEVGVLV
jgi:hypothetical protein